MNAIRKKLGTRIFSGVIALILSITLVFPSTLYAQGIASLPVPGTMITPSGSFNPPIMLGMQINPQSPFEFNFIISGGDDNLQGAALEAESQKLINYFLASMTVPEDEMWVNLSPYEKDRIIADGLSQTEMGRDLLAQDYMLKQFTASLMYPEEGLGEEFWKRVQEKAEAKFGDIDIPTNTFNKVWIMPEKASVYVHENNVFVSQSYLKVMLEEDYLAMEINQDTTKHGVGDVAASELDQMNAESKQLIREIMIPAIEREVNEGQHFSNLRQIFNSMILATWYKKNLRNSVLNAVYANENKIEGIDLADKDIKQKIFAQYLEAFDKGVYNRIKEEYDPVTQEVVAKKYFSGGVNAKFSSLEEDSSVDQAALRVTASGENIHRVSGDFTSVDGDASVLRDLFKGRLSREGRAARDFTRFIESGNLSAALSGRQSGFDMEDNYSRGFGELFDELRERVIKIKSDLGFITERGIQKVGEDILVDRGFNEPVGIDEDLYIEEFLANIDNLDIQFLDDRQDIIDAYGYDSDLFVDFMRELYFKYPNQRKITRQQAKAAFNAYEGRLDFELFLGNNRNYREFLTRKTGTQIAGQFGLSQGFTRLYDQVAARRNKAFEAGYRSIELESIVRIADRVLREANHQKTDGLDEFEQFWRLLQRPEGITQIGSYRQEIGVGLSGAYVYGFSDAFAPYYAEFAQRTQGLRAKTQKELNKKMADIAQNILQKHSESFNDADKDGNSSNNSKGPTATAPKGTLYAVLGVDLNASQVEIKKAYRDLATKIHPDKNPGDPNAKEKFQELNAANFILSDLRKRNTYDRLGRQRMAEKERRRQAERDSSALNMDRVGGIDLNPEALDLSESGRRINFEFDPAALQTLDPRSINGIKPVIINIVPVSNYLPLLGLKKSVRTPQLSKI